MTIFFFVILVLAYFGALFWAFGMFDDVSFHKPNQSLNVPTKSLPQHPDTLPEPLNVEVEQSQMLSNHTKTAQRTTTQLVGNGIAYFVFWPFVGFLLFIVFLMSIFSGSPEVFVASLILAFSGWVAHSIWLIVASFKASISTDKKSTPNKITRPKVQALIPGDTRPRIPCPMCAELILPQAKICQYCKSVINSEI